MQVVPGIPVNIANSHNSRKHEFRSKVKFILAFYFVILLIFEAKNDIISVIDMIENRLTSTKEKLTSTLLIDNSRILTFVPHIGMLSSQSKKSIPLFQLRFA
jgi:hypothetical protein